jgi:D-tyrosyl-tRNA(Tyr) deacylase
VRAVLQRVTAARVTVGERVVGEIGAGFVAFVGVQTDDGDDDVEFVARKIRDLRVFADDQGRMNLSVVETGGAVLVVSQFTLLADCRKGRRPSFDDAAAGADARTRYEGVIRALRRDGVKVETGEFQAMMRVELVNDGPVTLLLDSRRQL